MTVMSVDPGEHVGVARWTDMGELQFKGTMSIPEYMDYLLLSIHDGTLLAMVMEDYRLRQGRQMAQTGSRIETIQVIGMTRFYCRMRGTKIILQDPQILRIAALHADVKLPKGHIPDDVSAYLHGYWFFESQDLLQPVARAW